MKRLFIVAATVLAALFVTSCNKEKEISPIVGTWEISSAEITYQGETLSIDAADAGIEAEVIFNEDGTGTAKLPDSTETFKYTYANDIIKITVDGETENVNISIKGNTLVIMIDDYMMEGMKCSAKLYFVKK